LRPKRDGIVDKLQQLTLCILDLPNRHLYFLS
jgi:hypothetical protein